MQTATIYRPQRSMSFSLFHIFFCTISQKEQNTRRKIKKGERMHAEYKKMFISCQFDARNNRNRCRRQINFVPVKLFMAPLLLIHSIKTLLIDCLDSRTILN